MSGSRRIPGILAPGAILLVGMIGIAAFAGAESAEAGEPAAAEAMAAGADAQAQDGAIYEIRNYHFDPARYDEYAEVAKGEYIRYLREHSGHRRVLDRIRDPRRGPGRGAGRTRPGERHVGHPLGVEGGAGRETSGSPRYAGMARDLRRRSRGRRELPEDRVALHGVARLTHGSVSSGPVGSRRGGK